MTQDFSHLGKVDLRPFNGEYDAIQISRWISDPAYAHFFQSIGMVPTLADCRDYPRWVGNSIMMVTFNGNTAIGMVSMYRPSYRNGTCEMGTLIDKKYQDGGIGSEATRQWMDYLFSLGFRKLIVSVIDEGLCKPMLDYGFEMEGTHKEECLVDGKYVDEYRLAYTRRAT